MLSTSENLHIKYYRIFISVIKLFFERIENEREWIPDYSKKSSDVHDFKHDNEYYNIFSVQCLSNQCLHYDNVSCATPTNCFKII